MPATVKKAGAATWLLALLAIAGIVLSTISLATHYRKEATKFCDFGDNFNCDMVNRGPYATFATSAPLVFPPEAGRVRPWAERAGDAFTAAVMRPLNDALLRRGFKVPVAAIGLAGYFLLLLLAWAGRRNRFFAALHFLLAAAALVFCLYLTYLEKYVIGFWCVVCLSSLAVIALITLLSGVRLFRAPARR